MSDEPRYCHKCKAWHSPTDAGWKTGCVSSFAAPPGSAAVSADAWAIIGRAAMEKAQDAVADGKLGTADGHRKNAEMAFGFELKLRQPPNSVLGDPCKE